MTLKKTPPWPRINPFFLYKLRSTVTLILSASNGSHNYKIRKTLSTIEHEGKLKIPHLPLMVPHMCCVQAADSAGILWALPLAWQQAQALSCSPALFLCFSNPHHSATYKSRSMPLTTFSDQKSSTGTPVSKTSQKEAHFLFGPCSFKAGLPR